MRAFAPIALLSLVTLVGCAGDDTGDETSGGDEPTEVTETTVGPETTGVAVEPDQTETTGVTEEPAPGDDSDRITAALDATSSASHERVRRLGPVDDATKQWLLRHAAVLAYPSRDEGFGFPVLEANAIGTPVVAMSVGAIPEIAGDAAVHGDPGDRRPSTFADAISGVLTGAGRLGLIEAGYRNVRRFGWDLTGAGLIELYRTAMESG